MGQRRQLRLLRGRMCGSCSTAVLASPITDMSGLRMSARKWNTGPLLAHRTNPATGNGRIQAAARRALILNDGTATTAEVAARAYVRKLFNGSLGKSDYRHVRLAHERTEIEYRPPFGSPHEPGHRQRAN